VRAKLQSIGVVVEGVHCDVFIAQTNDAWGHIAGRATSIHFSLIVSRAQCCGSIDAMPSVDRVIMSQ
jgi:hypothetical protein